MRRCSFCGRQQAGDFKPGVMGGRNPAGKGMDISMDVDLIFKIAAIGIIVAVLNQVLIRSGREEQAMLTTLAGLIVVLSLIVVEISDLFRMVKSVFGL